MDKIGQQFATIRSVNDLGMEHGGVVFFGFIYGYRKGRIFGCANDFKALRELGHAVAVTHPDGVMLAHFPEAFKQRRRLFDGDFGAAKLADTPENFDGIVMPNLYGDILSDVAAQIAGSVGLAGSANIGDNVAMFEAIHGSAPRRAGQNLANPSGLFLGAMLMLVHIGQADVATRAHNAWLKTLEDGVHTYDIYKEGVSTQKVGTKEFAEAVAARMGQLPSTLKVVKYNNPGGDAPKLGTAALKPRTPAKKELVGVDVFLDWTKGTPDELAAALQAAGADGLTLTTIANRGAKVWPGGNADTFCTDHWRCRYAGEGAIKHAQISGLLQRLSDGGFDYIKIENLYNFDGEAGYSA